MLSKSKQADIRAQLERLVEQGGASGFQLALGYRDQCVGSFQVGLSDQQTLQRMTSRTWVDLASLTKIISTTSLLMLAHQRRLLPDGLDSALTNFFPSFASALKEKTIADLLNHRSGLPALFEDAFVQESREQRVRSFLDQIDRSYQNVNCDYSDVGFMLLGILIEQIFQKRLRDVFEVNRQGGDQLRYGPLEQPMGILRWLGARRVAHQLKLDSQEYLSPGVTQDPRAQWLDGDAGHAGLWGTAKGVEAWAQQIYRAFHGKDSVLSDRVVRSFIDFDRPFHRWMNGFDTPSQPSQSGRRFPRTTIGHLGYTGASFWMDVESGARVTLLCHRFDEGIRPERLRELRPDFHDWIWENVFSTL